MSTSRQGRGADVHSGGDRGKLPFAAGKSPRYSSMHEVGLGDEMIRRILVAVAALVIFADREANAQTTNATTPTASDHSAPDPLAIGQVCITIRELHETITVGRGGKGIDIELGGGACERPGSRISDLSAGFSTNGGMEDIVEGENCPAFQTRIDKLWAARAHVQHGYGTITGVRAGPFTITDASDLFQLQSPEGRRAAARWIMQTLVAVRPCWDTIREDRTHYVVDLLYSDLRRSAPAAIDAAIAQDRRQEQRQLHALSPEAQAQRDEDRQLHAAIAGRQTVSRPWIAIKGIAINRVEVENNGPGVRVDIATKIKNVGSAPTYQIVSNIDLIGFARIAGQPWPQRMFNSCDKANRFGKYGPGKVEHIVKPGEDVPIDTSVNEGTAFWPWNLAYDGADFLVAIGCVSYSLYPGPDDVRGASTFAYVIGRKVNGKFVPFNRGDGVVLGKSLRWLSLHQDYEQ